MLFRSCAASCLRAGDVGAAVGDVHDAIETQWLFPSEQQPAAKGRSPSRGACVPSENETPESARLPVLADSVEKVFFGWRPKILMTADAFRLG